MPRETVQCEDKRQRSHHCSKQDDEVQQLEGKGKVDEKSEDELDSAQAHSRGPPEEGDSTHPLVPGCMQGGNAALCHMQEDTSTSFLSAGRLAGH